jgi:GntR family transcriptional regulator
MQLLDIDPAAPSPIWRQIEDGVRRLVASGRLAPGAAIPSVRELSRALRVNPATVSRAYQRLTDAGLLEVRRGEGTFVAGLDETHLELERHRLLTAAAADFVGLAASLGAGRRESLEAVERSWKTTNEAGRGGTE